MLMKASIMIHCRSFLWNRNGWAIFALATMVTTVKIWHHRLCKKEPTHVYMWHFPKRRERERRSKFSISQYHEGVNNVPFFFIFSALSWTYFHCLSISESESVLIGFHIREILSWPVDSVVKEVFFRKTKQSLSSTWLHLAPHNGTWLESNDAQSNTTWYFLLCAGKLRVIFKRG